MLNEPVDMALLPLEPLWFNNLGISALCKDYSIICSCSE